MKLVVVAVGRLKSGPELTLIKDYKNRFVKTGRQLGFTALDIVEVDERKASDKDSEAQLILKAVPDSSVIWVCDERGDQPGSETFAKDLQKLSDQGLGTLTIVIGGADGLGQPVLQAAQRKIAFGSMVWPHMLVRVMLTEQLYRAASILAGLPYHRA